MDDFRNFFWPGVLALGGELEVGLGDSFLEGLEVPGGGGRETSKNPSMMKNRPTQGMNHIRPWPTIDK